MTPMPATVAERKGAISTRLVPCPRCEGYGISPLNQPVDELAEDE